MWDNLEDNNGGPHSLPTFVLIFWAPWSVHFNSSRVWNGFPYYLHRERKEGGFWGLGNDLRYDGYWLIGVRSVSPSYVYGGNGRRHASLFYVGNHDVPKNTKNNTYLNQKVWVAKPDNKAMQYVWISRIKPKAKGCEVHTNKYTKLTLKAKRRGFTIRSGGSLGKISVLELRWSWLPTWNKLACLRPSPP